MMKLFCLLLLSCSSLWGRDVYDQFIDLYEKYGNEKYMIQEEVTQKDHVLQAAFFAKAVGAPEEVIVALLFHDVGQVAEKECVGKVEILHPDHAEMGAAWLRNKGFPPFVCDFVENHALAKVILCERDPHYYERLSEASKISYRYQKEKYDEPKRQYRYRQLTSHPRREDILTARKVDDISKITGFSPPSFEKYREITMRVIAGKGAPAKKENWKENIDEMYLQLNNAGNL